MIYVTKTVLESSCLCVVVIVLRIGFLLARSEDAVVDVPRLLHLHLDLTRVLRRFKPLGGLGTRRAEERTSEADVNHRPLELSHLVRCRRFVVHAQVNLLRLVTLVAVVLRHRPSSLYRVRVRV